MLAAHGQQYKQRVVFGHLPLWPFSVGRELDILGDQELESLILQGNVDVVLNGHHHAYYPGYKNGINYISQACLGAGPRKLLGTDKKSKRSMTIIDFNPDGSYSIEALQAPEFTTLVTIEKLPPRIKTKWAEIIRRDLATE